MQSKSNKYQARCCAGIAAIFLSLACAGVNAGPPEEHVEDHKGHDHEDLGSRWRRSWDEHWRGYAERSCARVGDGHCHDEQHLKTHYDPRIQARHVAGHAHHHR
jgi:hypothetical protein